LEQDPSIFGFSLAVFDDALAPMKEQFLNSLKDSTFVFIFVLRQMDKIYPVADGHILSKQ
jgi:hypothetical protein